MDLPIPIITGSIAVDRIMSFDGRYKDLIHEKKLDVISISVLVNDMKVSSGGVAANIAYSMALLGNKPTLLGSVGRDSEKYMDSLEKIGVDTAHVHFSDLATATFHVITDSSHNQIGGFYPGAMSDSVSLKLETWANQNVFVCLSAHDPVGMRRQVEECRKNKIRLFYDPGQQVNNISGEDLKNGLAVAELVIVNEYECSLLCEKVGISENELGSQVPVLVITKGDKGSILKGATIADAISIPIARPNQLVDPTGAGDAYRAGFLHGYIRNWKISDCAQLGATVASIILEDFGTHHEFTVNQVQERYASSFNESINIDKIK